MEGSKKNKAIIVSGYFNPLHKGHIEYFHNAKERVDKLIVIVNNDFQRKLKNSSEFMLEDERLLINKDFSKDYELYFGNGGDQNNKSIPESTICNKLNIKLVDGLGDKIQSSSWLTKK